MKTFANLNIIYLGSYDVLFGMDWLDSHHAILDFRNKTYTCMDEEGIRVRMRCILRPICIKHITSLQLNKCFKKGFQVYAPHVEERREGKEPELQDFPMLQEFTDVFQELQGIPP